MTMNEYLIKYPWLRGYDPYPETPDDEQVCSLIWLPEGWVDAFGEMMCEEIDIALRKTDFYDQAYVSEAKEKYASMRLSIYPSNSEIDTIIDKYSLISEHVCECCGRPNSSTLNMGGWISVYCRDCYNKINADGRHKQYDEIANKDAKMPDVLKWTRYSTNGTEHFEMDISETTRKIRDAWKARQEFNDNIYDAFENWEERYNGA